VIPYPGESLTVRSALDVGGIGSALLNLVRYRADSATMAAGAEWTLWVSRGWPDYLDDDTTPLTVSWVVEVLSGSVTVTASEGPTATRGGSDATPTALGSHVLTVGTNVITSTFTATSLLTGANNMMLRLVATSGSAVVQQVKMRAWPTAGVVGGWSDPYPAYDRDAVPASRRLISRRLIDTSVTASWGDALGDLQSHADEAFSDATTIGSETGQVTVDGQIFFDGTAVIAAQFSGWIYTRGAADTYLPDVDSTLGLVEGVDYIRPPEEVFGDNFRYIDPLGPVTSGGWANTTLQTEVSGDPGPLTDGAHATFKALAYPGDPGTLALNWPDSSATSPPLSIPDVDQFALLSSHTWMVGPVAPVADHREDTLFVLGNGLYDFASAGGPDWVGLRSRVTFPSYRLWTPSAVVEVVRKVRQFHRDDGLGVTPPRAFGGASRIRTGRAYGYD